MAVNYPSDRACKSLGHDEMNARAPLRADQDHDGHSFPGVTKSRRLAHPALGDSGDGVAAF